MSSIGSKMPGPLLAFTGHYAHLVHTVGQVARRTRTSVKEPGYDGGCAR